MIVSQSEFISMSQLSRSILTRVTILLLKDEFSDFEELKMLSPVREEAIQLFVCLQE
jgi:hypothetical protein